MDEKNESSDDGNDEENAQNLEGTRHMLAPHPSRESFNTPSLRPSLRYKSTPFRNIWTYNKGNETYYVKVRDDWGNTLGNFCMNFFPRSFNFQLKNCSMHTDAETLTEIEDIKNHKHQNLLIYAAINNRIDIIKNLLSYNFDIDYEDDDHFSAVDHAWINYTNQKNEAKQKEISKIILFLLKSNSKFPKEELNFEYEKASDEVQNFIDSSEEMHRLIEHDDAESVQNLIKKNCELRFFYDRFNESAMFYGLKRNRINCLKAIDGVLSISRSENLSDIYGDFEDESCPINHHILTLNSMSKIVNKQTKNQECWRLINEAYVTLDKISICSMILRIVATCQKLWITFDFSGLSANAWKMYEAKPDGSIMIHVNAKIDKIADKLATLSSLIQKLCHLAIKIAFLNPNADVAIAHAVIKRSNKLPEDINFIEIVKKVFELYSIGSNNFDIFNYLDRENVTKIKQALKYLYNPENIVEWNDLIEPMQRRIINTKIIFQGEETTFNEIIGDDSEVLKFLTPKNIQEILLRNEKIAFCESFYCCNLVERKFVKYVDKTNENVNYLYIKSCDKDTGSIPKHKTMFQTIKTIFSSTSSKGQLSSSSEDQEAAAACKSYIKQQRLFNYQQTMSSVGAPKLFILIDSAGTGKSAAFEDLSVKLKKINAIYWVSLIKIRKYGKILEEFSIKTAELTINDVSILFTNILTIQSSVEAEIFKKMFKNNKIILLIDGLDEINDSGCDLLIKAIKLIKNETYNQLYVSTRPNLIQKLKSSLGIDSIYNLYPMTSKENDLIIAQTLKAHNFNKTSTEGNEIPEDLSKFMNILEHDSNKINNPLILRIIAQLYAENAINLSPDSLNLYEAFEAIYQQLELTLNQKLKHKFNWHHTRFTIDNIYLVYALKQLFTTEQIEDLAIIKNWEREKRHWTSKDIEQFGFLTVDLENDETNFKFIHKSFAEFFVANFILSFLFATSNGIRDEEFRKIINLLNLVAREKCSKFKNVATFVWDYIKTSDENFHKAIIPILNINIDAKSNITNFLKNLLYCNI